MRAILVRFMVSAVGLGIGSLVFLGAIAPEAILPASIMLTVLYILLRPLMQVLTLLPNLLLLGVVTPFTDALFIRWTAAWITGMTMGYWQAVALALAMSALYFPYSLYTQRRLRATSESLGI